MEKFISGKRYNTETATLIGRRDSDLPRDDVEWVSEALYKKRGGEFFLFGSGGSLTRYFGGDDIITPIPFEQAETWAKRYLPEDVYNREFVPSGDVQRVNLLVRAPKDVVDKFKLIMARRSLSSGELLAELLKNE